MIIKRTFRKYNKKGQKRNYKGLFLFGFIPLWMEVGEWHY